MKLTRMVGGLFSARLGGAPSVSLGVLVLAAAACSDPTTLVDGDIEVVADNGALLVRNRSAQLDLVTVIVELETSHLIDLAPCETWPEPIAPGGERRVRYTEVSGYSPLAEFAVVFWCQRSGEDVMDGGSLRVPFD